MKKILGLGNALTDILLQVSDGDLRELGLPKGSMSLITKEQAEAIQVRFASVRRRMVAGGSASNTVTAYPALARSPAQVRPDGPEPTTATLCPFSAGFSGTSVECSL